MNKAADPLPQDVAHKLQAHGLTVHVGKRLPKGADVDGLLRIGRGPHITEYVIEAKRALNQTTLGPALAQLGHWKDRLKKPALLITDYVTPEMAARIRAAGHEFADAAGNAYLNKPGVFVYITGIKPELRKPIANVTRTHATAGLKIQFALLCLPELAAKPQRAIAAAANVALGTIPPVLADLQRTGALPGLRKRRAFKPTRKMLDGWALDYARTLRPKTLLQIYGTPTFRQWKEWPLDTDVRWGGEPAANLLVEYLNPGVLTLYAPKLPPRVLAAQKMTIARHTEAQGIVEMRKPFWGEEIDRTYPGPTVPPVLVYADLLATGDARCLETAELVYEKYLARFIDMR